MNIVTTVPFVDELNAAVTEVQRLPRVRFDASVGQDAEHWIRKKHANGAVHEPATLAAFWAAQKRFAPRNVFDCGALYGYFTLFALQAFDAEVTAFEMHPGVLSALAANVIPYAKVVHGVVSDRCAAQVKFWVSGFNIYEEPAGGWEALVREPGAMKERGKNNRGRGFARAGFFTLDAYCAVNQAPDLLKIDVEAYQAKAILGGLGMIRAHRPVIIIELHDPGKIARVGTTNQATVQPLFDLGYTGYWCGNFRDAGAIFEQVEQVGLQHDKLSLMVFVPSHALG